VARRPPSTGRHHYRPGALLIGGVVGALITVDSIRDLWWTRFAICTAPDMGGCCSQKIVVTATLLVLAWRNRSTWLPSARAHRISAKRSRPKSLTELALMAVALTLAAALTVTG
jgi:copper resistance protein D